MAQPLPSTIQAAKDVASVLKSIQKHHNKILDIRAFIREQTDFPTEEQEKLLEQVDRDFKIILRRGEIVTEKARKFNVNCRSVRTINKLIKELLTYLYMIQSMLDGLEKLNLI